MQLEVISDKKISTESRGGALCATEGVSVCLGVLVLSWYPPGMADDNGEPTDDLVPAILDSAHQYNIQVSPLILEDVLSSPPSLSPTPLLEFLTVCNFLTVLELAL